MSNLTVKKIWLLWFYYGEAIMGFYYGGERYLGAIRKRKEMLNVQIDMFMIYMRGPYNLSLKDMDTIKPCFLKLKPLIIY